MKLYKKYAIASPKRIPFADVEIATRPFQLLPKVYYPASKLEATLSWQKHFAENTPGLSRFSVVVFTVGENSEEIIATLGSIAAQSYGNYEVIIVVCGQDIDTTKFEAFFQRFGFAGSIIIDGKSINAVTLAEVLPYCEGDYLVFADQYVLWDPRAFFIVAKQLHQNKRCIVYSNEVVTDPADDEIAESYYRRAPLDYFSPIATDPVGEYFFIAKEFASEIVQETPGLIIPYYLNGWFFCLKALNLGKELALVPLALYLRDGLKSSITSYSVDVIDTFKTIVNRYLNSRRIELEEIGHYVENGQLYLKPKPKFKKTSITVVVPFHNKGEITIVALESLAKQSVFPQLEIILIDNRSDVAELKKIREFLEKHALFDKVMIKTDDKYFNFARLNNCAVTEAKSEYILFLNNDVEFLDSKSIEELMSWALIEEVGVVGGRLVHEDGSLQHAGINFAAIRPVNVIEKEQFSDLVREVNAVTFALALVKKKVFQEVGGFDEFLCPNSYGDALFCKRVKDKGYRIIYTPEVFALHLDAASWGRLSEELELLEMNQQGLRISDLYSEFDARYQPMYVSLKPNNEPELVRLSRKISSVKFWGKLANNISHIVLRMIHSR